MEEKQVTELPAYAYSGREELEEIVIPAGITRIGRYAFYNCKNLKKLTLHSDIKDLGAGAFTGCHKIRCLEVTLVPGTPSCLKEFLSELPEEQQVILHGQQEARLWFPEFFEESIENTPARILSIETHGTGILYRNCFVKTVLQFEEYDERFTAAVAQERPELVTRMAFDRLMFPAGLLAKAEERYRGYLREHERELGKMLLKEKDMDMLRFYLRRFTPGEEWTGVLTQSFAAGGFPEGVACLMDYRRKHFTKKRRTFSL